MSVKKIMSPFQFLQTQNDTDHKNIERGSPKEGTKSMGRGGNYSFWSLRKVEYSRTRSLFWNTFLGWHPGGVLSECLSGRPTWRRMTRWRDRRPRCGPAHPHTCACRWKRSLVPFHSLKHKKVLISSPLNFHECLVCHLRMEYAGQKGCIWGSCLK